MLITLYSVPVYTGYFVFADDETPELFPYQDQMADSNAAMYVFLKSHGITFTDSVVDFTDAYSGAMSNTFQNFCKATNIDMSATLDLIKAGSGLLSDGSGKYYYSPEATGILNKFTNWVADSYGLNDDGTPQLGISFGEYGSENGYLLFGYFADTGTDRTHFDWGSCAPLGSMKALDQANGYTYSDLAPWGSCSLSVYKSTYDYRCTITDSGVSGTGNRIYSDHKGSTTIELIQGSPCLITDAYGSGSYTKVYKGIIQHVKRTDNGSVTYNEYRLYKGSLYKQYDVAIPKTSINFDYDGSALPDDQVTPTLPTYVDLGDTYNEYNSITYTNIVNNPSTLIVHENDPDHPDDTIPYNPYPDNPNYDPSDPYKPPTNTPLTPSDPNGTNNVDMDLDLDLNLPSINWSLGDLTDKFPFSIPFDLYNMFSVLNTEPQTPEIKGNVNLGIYQWQIDWNLHQFDDTAALLRNLEFVGFVIGLIFVTRNMIKG